MTEAVGGEELAGMAAGAAAGSFAAGFAAAGSVASAGGRAKELAKSGTKTISENVISRQTWMTFFGFAGAGVGLMCLAFMFLPMIVFAPQKFALLYTLGSLCFMGSFSVLKGHAAFISHLLSRDRIAFSSVYLSSMVGTLWASLIYRSYLLAIAFSGIQVCALSWFLVSYIPGGVTALKFASSIALKLCKGCCKCATGAGKGSLLPF